MWVRTMALLTMVMCVSAVNICVISCGWVWCAEELWVEIVPFLCSPLFSLFLPHFFFSCWAFSSLHSALWPNMVALLGSAPKLAMFAWTILMNHELTDACSVHILTDCFQLLWNIIMTILWHVYWHCNGLAAFFD